MLDGTPTDVSTDSSPVTTDQGADTSAATQNTGTPAPSQVPFHEHPRWQQLMQERTTDRQQMAQMRAQLEHFQRQAQQAAQQAQQSGQRQPTQDEMDAARRIRELQSYDPEYAKQQQRLDQLERRYEQMMQQQRTALTTQGHSALNRMASEAGLPTDAKSLRVLENAVTVYLADNPEAVQRFNAHDLSVLDDAFKEFNTSFLGKARRESVAGVATTKAAAAAIPTPPRNGGLPGPAAPPKVTAGNEGEIRSGMREKFRSLLMGGE